jgi:hypothetical protein
MEAYQKCEEIGGFLAEPRTRRFVVHTYSYDVHTYMLVQKLSTLVQEIKYKWHRKPEETK